MKILLTNDDGIHAPGILAVYKALKDLGEVLVVAPDRPRSATGHAITLHKPLRLKKVSLPDGATGYETNGVPADCVCLAVCEIMGEAPELLVSGINRGPNLGWDVTYSGTISAAMEGAVADIPSIAVSVAAHDYTGDYALAARFMVRLGKWYAEVGGIPRGLLNINIPNATADEIKGVALTTLGSRRYMATVKKETDPRGVPYYWIDGDPTEGIDQEGTDVHAILHNYISVTPVSLDLTCRNGFARMEEIRAIPYSCV